MKKIYTLKTIKYFNRVHHKYISQFEPLISLVNFCGELHFYSPYLEGELLSIKATSAERMDFITRAEKSRKDIIIWCMKVGTFKFQKWDI